MSTPFRLILPPQIRRAVFHHAQAELPNECCGLLAGLLVGTDAQVTHHFPLVNEAASPVKYLSSPRSMAAASKMMRQAGVELLAVYHSHPTSEPIPSRTDLAENYWPGVMQLIVSLQGGPPVLRAWWLTASDFREGELDSATDANQ